MTVIADAHVGIREATGNNDGADVRLILSSVGLSEGYYWCGAFPHRVYTLCGVHLEPAKSFAWVPTWFKKEKVVWRTGDPHGLVRPGDVVGFYSASLKRMAHMGILESETSAYFITIEGNTNGAGSRNGDGVYRKKRLRSQTRAVARWVD